MALKELGKFINDHYQVYEWRHATAVLENDFPVEWADLIYVLEHFALRRSSIVKPGGGKSPISIEIDGMFEARGWAEKNFDVNITVDGTPHPAPTHSVDYFKNFVAVETEWNNKDPFYDRDLNNFRLLHMLGVISVGVIITRATSLQTVFDSLGRGKSFGASTTHMNKLLPKMEGGGAGGCPVLAVGITEKLYDPTL
jgi:hypothetical protein